MSTDLLVAPRSEFSIEDPWTLPHACNPVRLRLATDATPPRLATTVAAYYDAEFLTLLFCGADDHVVATHRDHDAPLYEEDVVEAFLAPQAITTYFELEVNPLGATFDARIDSPDGVRQTMRTDLGWTSHMFAAIRGVTESAREMTIDTVLRVPFASLECATPEPGDEWRANFFRIDRHDRYGDEFSAWQPTMRTPADFHVAGAFGILRFSV